MFILERTANANADGDADVVGQTQAEPECRLVFDNNPIVEVDLLNNRENHELGDLQEPCEVVSPGYSADSHEPSNIFEPHDLVHNILVDLQEPCEEVSSRYSTDSHEPSDIFKSHDLVHSQHFRLIITCLVGR